MEKPKLEHINVSDIVVKPQVRTIFDDEPLTELTASIKKDGVIQPIAVNKVKGKLILVCGERRVRASKAAKVTTIPAAVYSDLTDDEVLQMQIIENLQRKDVHPMEEAIAFKKMLNVNKIPVDEIATRLSRSTKYIGSRLKLNDLSEEFQKAFYNDRMHMVDALEICKLGLDSQKEMYKSNFNNSRDIDLQSYHITKYKNELKQAPFDTKDANLVKAAGACTNCIHNTAANTYLFPDEAGKSICMNGKCFSNKCDISFSLKLKEAIEDPEVILVDDYYYGSEDAEKIRKTGEKVYKRNEVSNVSAALKKDIESGKVLKCFFVAGESKGKSGFVTIAKKSNSDGPTKGSAGEFKEKQSSGKATTADIKTEIERINSVEKRKQEIDMEKTWPEIYNVLYNNKKFVFNNAELSLNEKAGLIIMLLDNIGFTFDACDYESDEFLLKQGFKGSESSPEFFTWLTSNKNKLDGMINTLSRIFFYSNVSSTFQSESPEQDALHAVIKEYDAPGLKVIEDSLTEIRVKRAERIYSTIEKLNAQLKDKPAKKTGKGLKALLPDAE